MAALGLFLAGIEAHKKQLRLSIVQGGEIYCFSQGIHAGGKLPVGSVQLRKVLPQQLRRGHEKRHIVSAVH